MAAVIPLVSTTFEQQVFELLTRFRLAALAHRAAYPAAVFNDFSFTMELRANQALFSFTLPLAATNSASGGLHFQAAKVWGAESVFLINGQPFTINGVPISL
jgi:hypothetical protein